MTGNVLPERIRPTAVRTLNGSEKFSGTEASVLDFWRWALSDLRMNTIRPMVAEFLVARAVGDEREVREAWANFDVLSREGIRIEVKSSGYCQSWTQRELSRISFGRLAARTWDEETGELSPEREVKADVFVFAVQSCRDCSQYDPLDTSQWQFWVLSAGDIRGYRWKTVGLGWVKKHARGSVSWSGLRDAVLHARDAGVTSDAASTHPDSSRSLS
jgi:hypothetical protein